MSLNDSFLILYDMIQLLADSPDGMSRSEIAKVYDVTPRVINKYIHILENAGVPIYENRQRYYITEGYFRGFNLTAEEGEFLYIILERSLMLHSDRWSTMQNLLNKLGNHLMQPLSAYLKSRIDPERGEKTSDQHFRLLAKAKQKRYEVRVEYLPLRKESPSLWIIRPYRFTSNYYGDGIYVLCYGTSDGSNYIPLTLKLDRIVHASLSDTRFSVADLAYATSAPMPTWGVWNSERPSVDVHLVFEARHYDRLLETIWHPSQHIRVDNDGYVHFTVSISEPDEMVPWIRSWGSGVTVIEPRRLRNRIIHSLRRLMQNYNLQASDVNNNEDQLSYVWAKYHRSSHRYHLLIYHLLDVAAVAWHMWGYALSKYQQEWLADLLTIEPAEARLQIAFLVGLHDIGKATPAFQKKAPDLYHLLVQSGMPDVQGSDKPHGVLSAVILDRLLNEEDHDPDSVRALALVIGGHHGCWVTNHERKQARGATGGEKWYQLQQELFQLTRDVMGIATVQIPTDIPKTNLLATFLSGFTSVCDWIGSDETYFVFEQNAIDLSQYFEHTLVQADEAISALGWAGWQSREDVQSFADIFFTPNAMQRAVINQVQRPETPPRLILIEYPTGGGKTEIALYLADLIINLFRMRGIYVAMPTQATSNQMFGRVVEYLQQRYEGDAINLHLIHSQSQHQPSYSELMSQVDREGDESRVVAEKWFQNRRRSLLAPFAVGTIDQAMLSVLPTKHHFVRQFGLSHRVVIFDEIHAYDTFMNQIIERLLHWLNGLNAPAILLSATLPSSTKSRLLAQVGATETVSQVPYPRLTVVEADGQVKRHSLPSPPAFELQVDWLTTENLAEWLRPIYDRGGCIAIVCNTVDAAIDTARALRSSIGIDSDDVMLLHARMPFAWRDHAEAQVLAFFGKDSQRPERKILVATQIIEQSLDIDFDLMITSVAPIDLIIQRAGRLHRHKRTRPEHLQTPTIIIREPETFDDDIPDFGVDSLIYNEYPLLRTWQVLKQRPSIRIPDDMDELIEAVYVDTNIHRDHTQDPLQQALADAHDDLMMHDHRQGFRGKQFRIAEISDENLIGFMGCELPDDERIITTRDMQPGVEIVCLTNSEVFDLPADIQRRPTKAEVTKLLQYRLTIRKQSLIDHLLALPAYPSWRYESALRDTKPIVFDSDTFTIPGSDYFLRISPFYGLEMVKNNE